MGRVIHFEIPADDVTRASAFYEKVFGWKIQAWGGPIEYHLIETGPRETLGIDGAIMPREAPVDRVVNTVGVEDIEAARAAVRDAGGEVVSDVSDIPGVGKFCYGRDTEGNLFGLMQSLPSEG
jgi:uncharacterized protein